MLKIFLASHGKLASGMKSSLDVLLGNSDNVTVFDAYINENKVEDALDQELTDLKDNDQMIMLSDLYGGSVNQVMYLYLNRPNVKLVSGVNLAIVLELATRNQPLTDEEIVEIIEGSKNSMQLVEFDTEKNNDDEDDFF